MMGRYQVSGQVRAWCAVEIAICVPARPCNRGAQDHFRVPDRMIVVTQLLEDRSLPIIVDALSAESSVARLTPVSPHAPTGTHV